MNKPIHTPRSRRLAWLIPLLALPVLLSLACTVGIVPTLTVEEAAGTAVAQTVTAAGQGQAGGQQPANPPAGLPTATATTVQGGQPPAGNNPAQPPAGNNPAQQPPAGNNPPSLQPFVAPTVDLGNLQPAAVMPTIQVSYPTHVLPGDTIVISWTVTDAACGVELDDTPVNVQCSITILAQDAPTSYYLSFNLVAFGEPCSNPTTNTTTTQVDVVVATDVFITVVNNTSSGIAGIYIVDGSSPDWGGNWMGVNVLDPGQSIGFRFPPGTYDLRAVSDANVELYMEIGVPITQDFTWTVP